MSTHDDRGPRIGSSCPNCRRPFGRSDEEHKLLFGVIGLAFENWPHAHQYKPADAEALRAWLLIEAGHTEMLEADEGSSVDSIIKIGMFFCHGKKHFRIGTSGGKLILMRPMTIKKGEIKAAEFRAVADLIYQIIEEATDITPAIYKQQQENKKRVAA